MKSRCAGCRNAQPIRHGSARVGCFQDIAFARQFARRLHRKSAALRPQGLHKGVNVPFLVEFDDQVPRVQAVALRLTWTVEELDQSLVSRRQGFKLALNSGVKPRRRGHSPGVLSTGSAQKRRDREQERN